MPMERAGAPLRAGRRGALAQPLVEHLAIDHADEAAVDRHVDLLAGGRHHARRRDARDEQVLGNVELLDQRRRNRAAARLDAAGAVEQQHAAGRGARDRSPRSRRRVRRRPRRRRTSHWHPSSSLQVAWRPRRRRRRAGLVRVSAVRRAVRSPRAATRSRAPPAPRPRRTASPRPRTRARRRCPASRRTGARDRPRPCRRNRPAPKAMACAAPHMPMRTPARPARPRVGQHHHRADRRDGERAVGDAEQAHGRAQRPARPREPARREQRERDRRDDAAADRSTRAASPAAGGRSPASATTIMPTQHAGVLQPGQLRRSRPASGRTPCRRTARGSGPARCRRASTRTRRS